MRNAENFIAQFFFFFLLRKQSFVFVYTFLVHNINYFDLSRTTIAFIENPQKLISRAKPINGNAHSNLSNLRAQVFRQSNTPNPLSPIYFSHFLSHLSIFYSLSLSLSHTHAISLCVCQFLSQNQHHHHTLFISWNYPNQIAKSFLILKIQISFEHIQINDGPQQINHLYTY